QLVLGHRIEQLFLDLGVELEGVADAPGQPVALAARRNTLESLEHALLLAVVGLDQVDGVRLTRGRRDPVLVRGSAVLGHSPCPLTPGPPRMLQTANECPLRPVPPLRIKAGSLYG